MSPFAKLVSDYEASGLALFGRRAEGLRTRRCCGETNRVQHSRNAYRLIARLNFRTKRVFILFILTHREYSKGGWK
jgi:hypothetical protein